MSIVVQDRSHVAEIPTLEVIAITIDTPSTAVILQDIPPEGGSPSLYNMAVANGTGVNGRTPLTDCTRQISSNMMLEQYHERPRGVVLTVNKMILLDRYVRALLPNNASILLKSIVHTSILLKTIIAT